MKEIEFAYPNSKDLLECIIQNFENELYYLEQSEGKPELTRDKSSNALANIFSFLPLLGFVLRSTNVRNSFEILRPLLRLTRDVLHETSPDETKLILSSEWDFSPLTYAGIPDLPGFVLIGLPAPESNNPLLTPLFGHELGHSVWAKGKIKNDFYLPMRSSVLEILNNRWSDCQLHFGPDAKSPESLTENFTVAQLWDPSLTSALWQVEEAFCDFIGLKLFGASFLKAFAYLLSPNIGLRDVSYPSMETRVHFLVRASKKFSAEVPNEYDQFFDDDLPAASSPLDQFLLEVADAAVEKRIEEVMDKAAELVDSSDAPAPSMGEADRIFSRFEQVVPAEHCTSLADIINAAWRAFENPKLWDAFPELKENRDNVLNELVFKNIEIFEIEHVTKNYAS